MSVSVILWNQICASLGSIFPTGDKVTSILIPSRRKRSDISPFFYSWSSRRFENSFTAEGILLWFNVYMQRGILETHLTLLGGDKQSSWSKCLSYCDFLSAKAWPFTICNDRSFDLDYRTKMGPNENNLLTLKGRDQWIISWHGFNNSHVLKI